MKNLKSIVFILCMTIGINVNAQENKGINFDELLKTLNNVDNLGIDKSKQLEFKELNNSFVDQLKKLKNSSKSTQEKKLEFKSLFKERDNNLKSLFGSKDRFEKYKKKTKKTFKKSKRKAKWSLVKAVF